MLKINKKLKKKHKHKRGKGDDELFTPEELERYKKEQAEKAAREQAEAAAAEESSSGAQQHQQAAYASGDEAAGEDETSSAAAANDEWKKFKELTAGVDDILKKSQGDLGRIKETSYFKRKPPGPSEPDTRNKKPQRPAPPARSPVPDKSWVGFEEGAKKPEEPEAPPAEPEPEKEAEPQEEEVAEEEEEVEPEDDGLFDTSYVDVVTSGDIKLAYIPDSPTEPEAEGDDPFDTSIVDTVIKPTEIVTKDGKKKKLVSLGCAVDVLTGRLDKAVPIPVATTGSVKKRRVKPRDLLLADENPEALDNLSPVLDEPVTVGKSLLDAEEEIPEDLPVDIPVAVAPLSKSEEIVEKSVEVAEDKPDLKNLVAEFDIISTTPDIEEKLVASEESDDEFATLAAESIAKNYDPFDTSVAEVALGVENNKSRVPDSPDVDIILRGDSPSWDTTATLPKTQPQRPPPPRPQPPTKSNISDDPFDTSFAENIVPGKVELQIIESEVLGDITSNSLEDDDDFDPRAGEEAVSSVTIHVSAPVDDIPEPIPLTHSHRDLLGGSSTDLSNLVHEPIEPAPEQKAACTEDYDPFDTSVVDVLAPGKAELKVLEEELLTQVVLTADICDDEFDPRGAADIPIANPPSPSARRDLLSEAEETAPVAKPLTPIPGNQSAESESPVDPFDTTFAENLAPGKTELRIIESELVRDNLSDDEFDPRKEIADVQVNKPASLPIEPPADLLSAAEGEEAPHKPLTPAHEQAPTLEIDPFDTSLVSPVLAPGPAELRQLESELEKLPSEPLTPKPLPTIPQKTFELDQTKQQQPAETKDLLSDTEQCEAHRPLSPQAQEESELDPFDTSFAGDLLPGRAELKLLEAELIGQ